MISVVLAVLLVVVSCVGIGFLCAYISPGFIALAVVEGLGLGWLNREAYF